jgi:hypothetical protein
LYQEKEEDEAEMRTCSAELGEGRNDGAPVRYSGGGGSFVFSEILTELLVFLLRSRLWVWSRKSRWRRG